MHIFLTGPIQIGKSTVIRKVLTALDVTPGGFVTGFGAERYQTDRSLYMNAAWLPPSYDRGHTVVRFGGGQPPQADAAAFDRLGCGLLAQSRPWAQLLLMDECGQLEKNAASFRQAVMDCLDQPVPVLGVLKQTSSQWLEQIAAHPAVTVMVVSEANRDQLPMEISRRLQSIISAQ